MRTFFFLKKKIANKSPANDLLYTLFATENIFIVIINKEHTTHENPTFDLPLKRQYHVVLNQLHILYYLHPVKKCVFSA